MNVVVTGGAGYIGSVVASELLKGGHEVAVYDDLSRGHREAVPAGAELMVGDIADDIALAQLFDEQKTDAVMHFAALSEAGESVSQPERYFRNNTVSTRTLLETMSAHGIKKLVFSSTAAVYGNPDSTPIEETDELNPVNPYGESKRLVEEMLEEFNGVHGLRYASLRYFNAAGAHGDLGEDHRPESHLIPRILRTALDPAGPVSIYGTDYPTSDGTCVRDYVHVSDLSAAHLLALDALEGNDKLIYNLGNGSGFSVREVIETAIRVTGVAIPVVEAERRPGDPAVLVASSEKIQRELNWRPQFPELEKIISSAWAWHSRHPYGYRQSNESTTVNA
jgi:UDP-glucose 4-epimerase